MSNYTHRAQRTHEKKLQLIPHQSDPGAGRQVKKVRVRCPGRVRIFPSSPQPSLSDMTNAD